MTPEGFTERYTRSQLFTLVACLGSVLILGCALEAELPDKWSKAAAVISPVMLSAGIYFFGFRSLVSGAVCAFSVRFVGLDFEAAGFLTIRDVVIAALSMAIVNQLQWFKPKGNPFDQGSEGFHAVLKAVPDVLLIFDSKQTCRQVFTGDTRLLVRPAEEIVGRQLAELMPSEQTLEGQQTVEAVLRTGVPGSLEHEINLGGELKTFAATIVPFEFHGDKAVLWASREITQIKQIQKEQSETEEMLRNLLRLQERERKLISCELHDGILQHIIVAHMLAQVLKSDVGDQVPDASENLDTIQQTLADAIKDGRALIEELRPIMVDEDNVVDAIDYMVKEEGYRGKAQITFNIEGEFSEIPPLLEGNIFRIVQEALANVRRHSSADKVSVSLSQSENNVNLKISDNGIGFDPTEVPHENFGLKSINRRARLFGGSANVESSPGKGTTVAVTLPISDAPISTAS